jgi:hypothetical protein
MSNIKQGEDTPPVTPTDASATPSGGNYSRIWRWGVSLVVLAVLFAAVDRKTMIGIIIRIDPVWFFVGVFFIGLEQVVMTVAWRGMLISQGLTAPVGYTIRLTFISNFVGFAFPSTAGPDALRVYGMARYFGNDKIPTAISSLFILRLAGFVTLYLIALTTSLLFRDRFPTDPVIEMTFTALLISFGFFVAALASAGPLFKVAAALFKRVGLARAESIIRRIHDAYALSVRSAASIGYALGGATYIQITRIGVAFIAAKALGLPVELIHFLVFVPVAIAISTLPVSVAGLGLREGAFVLLFGAVGLSGAEALTLSLTVFFITLMVVAFGGVVYWFSGFSPPTSPD